MTGALEPPGGRLTDHISLGVLSAAFSRDLIEEVLGVTGRREKRSRLLPAHVMVRYVIALGLFFGQAYEEVMRQMTGALQSLGSWDQDWKVPSTSAITQARQRLGAAPLRELFHRAAVPVADLGTTGAWLRGRRLMAIDGTSFDVPDTAANVAAFGRKGSGPKASAFPKLQVVSLSECGTHAKVAAARGSCRTGERELAAVHDYVPRARKTSENLPRPLHGGYQVFEDRVIVLYDHGKLLQLNVCERRSSTDTVPADLLLVLLSPLSIGLDR